MVHDNRGRPQVDAVTIFADGRRLNMCSVLASGIGAVVTIRAVAAYAGVIEIGRRPADRCVAVVAVITADEMCRVLAGGADAVVT